MKDIKIYLKKKKKKSGNIEANFTKIPQRMKKSLLSIEKVLQNEKKHLIIKSNDS